MHTHWPANWCETILTVRVIIIIFTHSAMIALKVGFSFLWASSTADRKWNSINFSMFVGSWFNLCVCLNEKKRGWSDICRLSTTGVYIYMLCSWMEYIVTLFCDSIISSHCVIIFCIACTVPFLVFSTMILPPPPPPKQNFYWPEELFPPHPDCSPS